MQKAKQFSFFKEDIRSKKFFGGALLKGRRRSLRPLTSKDSIHFVLRSTWGVGSDSFLNRLNYRGIHQIITRFAKKFGVRIYHRAINSNHLHLLLRITNRRLYKSFIKAVSGQIASHVMGQQSFLDFSRSRIKPVRGDGPRYSNEGKKKAEVSVGEIGEANLNTGAKANLNTSEKENLNLGAKAKKGFWQFRPFSRIVNRGRDFNTCSQYLKQNVLEAFRFVAYRPRKNIYAAWIESSAPDLNSG